MKKYQIVRTSDKCALQALEKLEKNVDVLMERGWKPIGGVSVSDNYYSRMIASQAMVYIGDENTDEQK